MTHADGRPFGGVYIVTDGPGLLPSENLALQEIAIRTDRRGRFVDTEITRPGHYGVTAFVPGYLEQTRTVVVGRDGWRRQPLRFTLRRAPAISYSPRGRVVDVFYRPLFGAAIVSDYLGPPPPPLSPVELWPSLHAIGLFTLLDGSFTDVNIHRPRPLPDLGARTRLPLAGGRRRGAAERVDRRKCCLSSRQPALAEVALRRAVKPAAA